jgi:hypothetical protein
MTWFGRRLDKKHPLMEDSSQLIADTEAFLAGNYAGRLLRNGEKVPGWAQLNQFAHGDIEILCRARRPPSSRRQGTLADPLEEAWRTAHELLSREITRFVRCDPWLLSHLQRSVLVPLELQLMHKDRLTAFELVEFTRMALRSTL